MTTTDATTRALWLCAHCSRMFTTSPAANGQRLACGQCGAISTRHMQFARPPRQFKNRAQLLQDRFRREGRFTLERSPEMQAVLDREETVRTEVVETHLLDHLSHPTDLGDRYRITNLTDRVLEQVTRDREPVPTTTVANGCGVTNGAALRHLKVLESNGLVERLDRHNGGGHAWLATTAARNLHR